MADTPTRILSLFSGIGGLDLGIRRAFPGSRVVAYVEREAFACEILLRRMEDGQLDAAPVFAGDVREFPAARFRGHVDAVSAGFPCPPVSNAGRRRGSEDERWMWPEVLRVLRETSAEWCLVENVPGLLTTHAGREFGGILADLGRLGYDAEWGCLPAAAVGAPHLRKRIFLLARRRSLADAPGRRAGATQQSGPGGSPEPEECVVEDPVRAGSGAEIGDPLLGGWGLTQSGAPDLPPLARRPALQHPADDRASGTDLGNPHGPGLAGWGGALPGADELPPWPPGPEDDAWTRTLQRWPELAPALPESVLCRMAHGVPAHVVRSLRVDMLRALGNAVVPAQAEAAFRILHARLMGRE